MHLSNISIIVFLSSVVLVALAALSGNPLLYLITSGIIGITVGLRGLRDLQKLHALHSSPSTLSAAAALHMGLVWAWGGGALFISYSFFLPPWREWVLFSTSFAIIAAFSLFFASLMSKDAQKGKEDLSLLKVGRFLTIIQLCGTVAAVVGLIVDPQKFFLNVDKHDWAANNIFFFGALGLAIISTTALFYSRKVNGENSK
ncbi:MAG: hypothetical protein ACKOW3_03325 [Hyphomicrobium sp.]